MKIKPSEIIIKERIRKDNGDIEALVDSLGEDLQGAPITITKDNVLIDGYRRLMAWKKQYKNEPIECFVYEGDTDKKLMEAKMLLMSKEATVDERYLAGQIAEAEIEKKSCSTGTKIAKTTKEDLAGKKLGVGRITYFRTKETMKPELKNEIGIEKDKEIKKIAREKSVRTAYDKLKEVRQDMGLNKNFPKQKEKSDINKFLQECIDRQSKTNSVLKEILANKDNCDSIKLKTLFDLIKRTFIIIKDNKEVKEWKLLK